MIPERAARTKRRIGNANGQRGKVYGRRGGPNGARSSSVGSSAY